MSVDAVFIGAHPDDVELIAGGTVAKLVAQGHRVAVIDLTRGECGSRGSAEVRAAEAAAAAGVLGLAERVCLDLGDNRVADDHTGRARLIEELRRLRPAIVVGHYWEDYHPDHLGAAELLKSITYAMGFANHPAGGRPFRPGEVLHFMGRFPIPPSIVVDVSDVWEVKMAAIRCYKSQLFDPNGDDGPKTTISRPDFLPALEGRARYFGSMIERRFGEPFHVRRPVPVDDLVVQYAPFARDREAPA